MLANQLARRGVQAADHRPAFRAGAADARDRRAGAHLEIYARWADRRSAGAAAPSRAAPTMWANGAWKARIPVGDIGQDLSPIRSS
jgi:hypothetical protein